MSRIVSRMARIPHRTMNSDFQQLRRSDERTAVRHQKTSALEADIKRVKFTLINQAHNFSNDKCRIQKVAMSSQPNPGENSSQIASCQLNL